MNPEAPNNEQQFGTMRVKQAAVMLSVSTRTIWRMFTDGQLTRIKYRRCTRVALAEVHKHLQLGIQGVKI
jgi:excisionase family DNA binding protein